ncbi:hypothetical protein DFR58_10192 [Anaerobacterium chartisolvens]|uniref:Uncharacterized protein n=1 Tax=Anaerobacterium chartisolvens TaxID=1297424 RepID=A0A369BH61_9FIRM|nr:DUF6148 family protein [Anaerobacterium chartisolvens]RCX20890.1 hypothetical protein DFR58_10192 [Anaerobacterium chartisolvens]
MSVWTLEEAKAHLKVWLEAEIAVATVQSYQMGSKRLDKADLAQIREQVKFWKNEIREIQNRGKRKVFRITPRDL